MDSSMNIILLQKTILQNTLFLIDKGLSVKYNAPLLKTTIIHEPYGQHQARQLRRKRRERLVTLPVRVELLPVREELLAPVQAQQLPRKHHPVPFRIRDVDRLDERTPLISLPLEIRALRL